MCLELRDMEPLPSELFVLTAEAARAATSGLTLLAPAPAPCPRPPRAAAATHGPGEGEEGRGEVEDLRASGEDERRSHCASEGGGEGCSASRRSLIAIQGEKREEERERGWSIEASHE